MADYKIITDSSVDLSLEVIQDLWDLQSKCTRQFVHFGKKQTKRSLYLSSFHPFYKRFPVLR